MKSNDKTKNMAKIAELLGVRGHIQEEVTPDELLALLLQISIALLMVFMMAYLLFRTDIDMEIQEVRETRDLLRKNKNLLTSYPVEIKKLTLLNALDEIERNERDELGLNLFRRENVDGGVHFVTEGLLDGDKVADNALVRHHFLMGCERAKRRLADLNALRALWRESVLREAMSEDDGAIASMTPELDNWLNETISERITMIREDTLELQRALLSHLQSFYIEHPEALRDEAITDMVEKYRSASENERNQLIIQLRNHLYSYAKSVFEKQNVPLLNDI